MEFQSVQSLFTPFLDRLIANKVGQFRLVLEIVDAVHPLYTNMASSDVLFGRDTFIIAGEVGRVDTVTALLVYRVEDDMAGEMEVDVGL